MSQLLLPLRQYIETHSRVREGLWNVLVYCAPLLVYLLTLAPTVYGLDSAELTTGAAVLGIVHAPGSPLYLVVGHVFIRLVPWGDVGYRLNLMNALIAALTVLLVYRILWHLTARRSIAVLSAWFLAFTYYFWTSAVAAELYALNACFVAGLIWLGLQWREYGRAWQWLAMALFYGLGLGNHTSLILIGPGLAWLALSAQQVWRKPRWIAGAMACGLVGASIFLYLPIRHLMNPPLDYARDYWNVNLATADGLWWMITGSMFKPLFGAIPLDSLPQEMILYLYRLWSNALGLGFIIGLIGLTDCRRRPALHLGLGLMMIIYLLFYLTYGAADKEMMFLPTYLIWGIWVGLGANVLCDYMLRRAEPYATLPIILLLMLAGSGLFLNYSLADLSRDRRAREWGERIFATVDPNAVFIGSWVDVPVLEYLQLVEGQRRDVQTVNVVFVGIEQANKLALEKLREGYPVYTSAPLALDDELELEPLDTCPCSRVLLK